ncbi:uncharacterized protein [Cardiocondyla obscurior]|uniref:uncharacterized protein n=1 Tax=Cardiocondyla obscurior TaxID=286306 RepID=UPI0039656715
MAEIRRNLRTQNNCNNISVVNNCVNVTHTGTNNSFDPSTLNISLDIPEIRNDVEVEDCNTSDSSSSHVSERNDDFSLFFECSNEVPFSERLASCFIDNNITHVQGNNILALLRTHSCLSSLPKDVRTLLGTPRNRAIISFVEPGEYLHFDIESKLIESLLNYSIETVSHLELDFNTDGCNLDKTSTIHIWPIQARIVNLQHIKPIVLGIYKGAQKPGNAKMFFEKFVRDIRTIISNGGITFRNKKVEIRLRCFIADAPARAFILNHRGHMSSKPCSKCKVSGTYVEGRSIFNGINHSLRTDEEYLTRVDDDHHKEGESPLSLLPIRMVTQVPFEYMHLVCLGVVKKLLSAWVCGNYSRISKLSGRTLSIINARLNVLAKYCPLDFVRRPRSLSNFSKFKATEFRQFLLYTGPVVLYGLLHEELYKHFLFLHAAFRALVLKSPSAQHLTFAELALQKFVLRSANLYSLTFITYNVHGLLHITDDVRRFGNVDSFSAFPYENNMSIFKKFCRKPGLPLQQFYNRMVEIQKHGTNMSNINNKSLSIHTYLMHNNDTNCLRYRRINFNNISLGIDTRNKCCILYDDSICIIKDISMRNNSYKLTVQQYLDVEDFYDVGLKSSVFQFYKCTNLSNQTFNVSLNDIRAKCYRMPFWSRTSMDDSDTEENDRSPTIFIVAVIIHSEST